MTFDDDHECGAFTVGCICDEAELDHTHPSWDDSCDQCPCVCEWDGC